MPDLPRYVRTCQYITVGTAHIITVLAYQATRRGWGRLCRLLTLGNRRARKGDCILRLEDLLAHCEDLLLVAMPGADVPEALVDMGRGRLWLGAVMRRGGDDKRRLAARMDEGARLGLPLLASNDALYAAPEARPQQDCKRCRGRASHWENSSLWENASGRVECVKSNQTQRNGRGAVHSSHWSSCKNYSGRRTCICTWH